LDDLSIDGRTIPKLILKNEGWKFVGWIYLAQYKNKWLAFVKAVKNFRILYNSGNSVTS